MLTLQSLDFAQIILADHRAANTRIPDLSYTSPSQPCLSLVPIPPFALAGETEESDAAQLDVVRVEQE